MTYSQSTSTSPTSLPPSTLQGDTLILISSLLYSLHVIRLSDISPSTPPLTLSTSKASYEFLYGLLLILTSLFLSPPLPLPPDFQFTNFFQTSLPTLLATPSSLPPVLLATLWTGLVTCAYTIFAQSYGQASVKPSDANLIYTTQPVWSAAFAGVLLGERLEGLGWVGAAVVGGSLAIETWGRGGKEKV